jgi:hypothetical protein
MTDERNGSFGGIRIGRGNRSSQKKLASMQITLHTTVYSCKVFLAGHQIVGIEIIIAVNMKIIVFWYVAPCKLVDEGIILL